MIPPQRNALHPSASSQRGITITQLVVCLGLAVIVVILLIPTRNHLEGHSRTADQLNNGRQIYLGMRAYAQDVDHAGAFPTFADPKEKSGIFATSDEAFSSLLPNYLDDKKIFSNKASAWCYRPFRIEPNANPVSFGENDWCYVRGLTDKSNARWPLLANAFAPGTTHYVNDQRKPGGVWKGEKAIVIWTGGSAEIAETRQNGDRYFIERPDKPTVNAFEKEGEWLAGENVKVLYPATP